MTCSTKQNVRVTCNKLFAVLHVKRCFFIVSSLIATLTAYVQVSLDYHTLERECCKGDDESQWERGKFDPPPPKNPLTDGDQNLCR